jgi:hypothetical protein
MLIRELFLAQSPELFRLAHKRLRQPHDVRRERPDPMFGEETLASFPEPRGAPEALEGVHASKALRACISEPGRAKTTTLSPARSTV